MTKSFEQYAAERAMRASAEERNAIEAFDIAYASYAIGAALAVARKARHLNQTELAALTGMSQGDVSRIERGQVAPTMPTIAKMVEALGGQLTLRIPTLDSGASDEGDLVLALE
jgi:ribosome-binding protein aMBF1 (putative translation factor)